MSVDTRENAQILATLIPIKSLFYFVVTSAKDSEVLREELRQRGLLTECMVTVLEPAEHYHLRFPKVG